MTENNKKLASSYTTLLICISSLLLALLNLAAFILLPRHALLLIIFLSVTSPLITAFLSIYFHREFVAKPSTEHILKLLKLSSTSLLGKETKNFENNLDSALSELTQTIEFAAENLRETRRREKSLISNAADVICVINTERKILQVNPASISVWGYKPEELIGKALEDYLDGDNAAESLNNILGAEKSIAKITFENSFCKKSGGKIDLLWSAHWSASDGGLFCVAHDITDRKRAEKVLRESEERVRSILENMPTAVLVLSKRGLIEFMNPAAQNAIRLDFIKGREENIHSSETLSFCKDPFASKDLDDLIELHGNSSFDSQIKRLSGERFPAEIVISRLDLNREPCYLIIFVDVTSKHEIERMKREFVAMVSHDLKTPLTSVASSITFLEEGIGGELNAKGKLLLERAGRECNRLINLVKDLLDLEKMKAGKFTMHFDRTELSTLAKSACDAVDRFASLHKVQLQSKIPNSLFCHCDGARIIQVLVNLLDNAVKFSPTNEFVILEAHIDGDFVNVSVSNKGREIPLDKLASIFEKFEQVEESDARDKKGSGLGLAICKTIIEQHGGKISVSSSKEAGTKFNFTLPLSLG